LHKDLIEEIEFQISETDRVFEEYDLFFQDMNYEAPDLLQKTVMANILHSFYTGIEKIFERIAKEIDKNVPTGNKSHQELLNNMYVKNNIRKAVINEEIYLLLNEYMKFRHFFRHAYSFQLNWAKMKPLAETLFDIWENLKRQLLSFISVLEKETE